MFFPSHLYTGSGSDQKVPAPAPQHWAQRKLSPLNILLLINGPLLSLGFNGFNN